MPSLVPRIPTDTVTGSPYLVADLGRGLIGEVILSASLLGGISSQIWTGVRQCKSFMTQQTFSLLFDESVYFHSLFEQDGNNYLPDEKVLLLESIKTLLLCALCSNAFVQAIALALSGCSRT
ncbi:hypothetical protein [Anabaena sp. UHCC 0451]|uniref:hypothetical protein n=1 Tax=Anabaena sp. UHCC 0451 TaxID=2055235 RepID=UPI002B213012|nr:hypothetical protein [Anabaena sp. UHCC 0451]MEA5575123.1 hypothetical protein [Anabaena sp. UHCC 0451]